MYIVKFGKSINIYYTWYHIEQFTRALRLNGTEYTVEMVH